MAITTTRKIPAAQVNVWYALKHYQMDSRTHIPVKIEGTAWVLEGRMGEGDAGYTLDSGAANKLSVVVKVPQVRITGTFTNAYFDTPLDLA